jgi:hypothetical protein
VRKTTDAFQVATSVLYQSGIQHFGITPNNLTEQPTYVLNFMKSVPTVWDETRFIDGYPGRYCVIARRCGATWYIAATNATKEVMKLNLSLPWLAGKQLSVIHDKADRSAGLQSTSINKKQILTIEMQPLGGAMIYTN